MTKIYYERTRPIRKKKWGKRAVYGGIVAGIIGLLASWESLLVGGVGLAASGEIFRRVSKKPSHA